MEAIVNLPQSNLKDKTKTTNTNPSTIINNKQYKTTNIPLNHTINTNLKIKTNLKTKTIKKTLKPNNQNKP